MATYILADNQPLTRLALHHLLEPLGPDAVLEVEDKASLIELLKAQPDVVVLLDYTLFDFNEVQNLLNLVDRYPQSHWVLVSDDLTQEFMRNVVYQHRRISIVFKDDDLSVISESLRSAAHGQRYICQKATEILLEHRQLEERRSPLTSTETEILRAIAQGKTTREIAADRFSSIHTINTHRKNIFHKLRVNTAHEAISYAFKAGLIEPSEFYI